MKKNKKLKIAPPPEKPSIASFFNKSIYFFLNMCHNSDMIHHSIGKTSKHIYRPNVGKKLASFTLAEVLITLGIIGIVAALTIPAFVQNTKKEQASARIKKFISVINQALISAEAEYGPKENWERGEMETSKAAHDFLSTYISPYIKSLGIEDRKLFGKEMATIRFVDGSQMSVKIGSCYDIYYDINGEKKPNELGRDMYAFILCRTKDGCNLNSNHMEPYYCAQAGYPYPTKEELMNNCKEAPRNPDDNYNGQYCSKLLELNQYNFPKDYPKRL